jgi:uncharacterized protein (TIGR03437 family)
MNTSLSLRLLWLAVLLAVLLIPAVVLRRTAAQGGGPAGMLDDNMVHLPANYTTFTPPALGVTFNDSAYNTLITRLSNGVTQFPGGDGVHHEYAVMSPFNADNTRILVAAHLQGFYVIDRTGAIIVPPAQVNISHLAEPCWSTTNPNIFYFRETNRLCQYNIATQTKSVIRTFNGAGCPAGTNCPNFTSIRFGRGEADISEDGDHLVIMGDAPSVAGEENTTGLYTIGANTLGPTAVLNGGLGVDHCDVTPNNNIICRYNTNGPCTPPTTDCFKGYAVFNGQTMAFVRQVMPWGAHADRGRDANGDEVLLIAAYNDNDSVCPGYNGVEKVKLSDGSKTCLVSLDFASEIHISANSNRVNGVNTNPWLLVSYTDTGKGTANPNATLPANWQTLWGVRYNELLLIKIDGTERRRLLHHRTRKVANDDYWFTPRAALSRDGRYAVFDSNPEARTTPDDYTDVYLADLVAPCTAPGITMQPGNQTVCLGAAATFSVTANGTGLTYQWRKNNVNISGATNSSYTINPVAAGDAGSYDVVVSGACGAPVTSTAATLTVNEPPAITAPPASLTKCVGQSATFSVTATGAGLTYQWRKNSVNISGATSSSYTIAAVVVGDAGSYDVVVSGACTPAVTSTTATLTVNAPPAITMQPISLTKCEGQAATFSVTATGAGLTYQWRKNGADISGATNSSYTIAATAAGDAGSYDVIVSGTCTPAATSTAATLTINAPPAVTTPPASMTKCVGQSATFSVTATGAGLTYQWRKNGSDISGAASSSYTIAAVAAGDAGSYDVLVSGTCSPAATSAAATLTVNAPPAITMQPASLTRTEGQSATFSVAATGAGLTYQWRKGGINISGATGSSYTIAAVTLGDAGSYDVVVSGACNPAVTSTAATLTVQAALTLANAASYQSAEFAVESVVAAFGKKLANLLLSATGAPLPTSLGGTSVNVHDSNNIDRAAGLYFITPDRLNFLLPPGTAPGLTTVTINSPLGVSMHTITAAAVAPGFFAADGSGAGLMKGYALRTNGATQTIEAVARFDPVSCQWVAAPLAQPTTQVKLVLLGTGFRNRTALSAVMATIGGAPATVVSANASGLTIGFDELCLQLPALSSGLKDIAVTVDGKAANIVKIQIQ